MTRIINTLVSIVVITFLFISSGYCAAYTWKSVAVRGGGFVTGVIFHPLEQGLAYCKTDMGGAYRWDMTDSKWIPLTDYLTRNNSDYMGILSLAVDPSDVNKVYMLCGKYTDPAWAGYGAVLSSSNRGSTWTINPLNFRVGGNEVGRGAGEKLAVDPNMGSVIFAGTSGNYSSGLWKSTNSGSSFAQVTSFPQSSINFIIFDKTSGTTGNATQTIYVSAAVNGSSLYKSTNGGNTWTLVPNQPSGLQAFRGVLSGTTLYLTYANNNGPNNGAAIGGVYKVNTTTNVFVNITPVSSPNYGYSGISVDPQNSNNVVVTSLFSWARDYVYYSNNGGTSWTEKNATAYWDRTNAPYTSSVNPHWLTDIQIDPYNSDRAFFNTGYGFWETTNLRNTGAVTWRFSNRNLEETVAIDIISPPSGAPLVSAMGDYDGFVHNTLDDSPVAGRLSPNKGTCLSIDFAESVPSKMVRTFNGSDENPNEPYGAYSTNGGSSWVDFGAFPSGLSTLKHGGTRAIAISANGNNIVWSPQNVAVSYSSNNGSSWTASSGSPPMNFEPVSDRVNSNKFYIFNGLTGYVWVSTNGGQSFSQGGFTATGGVDSWAAADGVAAVAPGNDGHLWATTGRNGLYRSTNSGTSFTKVNSVTEAYRVGFGMAASGYTYPAIYLFGIVGGNLGFYRSIDTGASWERINTNANQYGYVHQIIGDPRVFGRCYVSAEGRGIVYGEPAGTPTPTGTNTPFAGTATFTRTSTRTPTVTTTSTPAPPVCSVINYDGETASTNIASGAVWVGPGGSAVESAVSARSGSNGMTVNIIWPDGYWGGFGWNWTNWGAKPATDLTGYNGIEFWIRAASGTITTLAVTLRDSADAVSASTALGSIGTTWQKITIPLSALTGINLTSVVELTFSTGGSLSGDQTFYFDDFGFSQDCGTTVPSPTRTPVPPTATFTRTSTPNSTATRTNSPVPPTATFTRTSTISSTVTGTNTPVPPTMTFTATATASPTWTRTNTPVVTPSNTPAGTLTSTPIVTATFTMTRTASPTLTATITPTGTRTNTPVVTPSNTPAGTLTNSPTPSASATTSPTPTATAETSATASSSSTPIVTATFTVTRTATGTLTPYPVTPSFTATQTNTIVVTPSNTPAGTLSPTSSFTTTATPTPSGTLTPYPASPSFTATGTNTLVPTQTFTITPSRTATLTSTPTRTSTPTFTRTVIPATATITPVADSTVLKITKTDTHPNPVNLSSGQGITVEFYATKRCVKASFVMYTRAFRKILVVEKQGPLSAGNNTITVENGSLKNLSPGVYYGQVTAEDEDGEKERGKAVVVVVLR